MIRSHPLSLLYDAMRREMGPQGWWPARTPFEVAVGAILTQNTNWRNVEKAIARLAAAGAMNPKALRGLERRRLERLIRPAGTYRVKAERLRRFLDWLFARCGGRLRRLANVPTKRLRGELLSIPGIGPETADAILLYALGRASFVVDAYTHRILVRHGLEPPDSTYESTKAFFEATLTRDPRLFNEYHALLVRVGKEYCRRRLPRCDAGCPLGSVRE